jgi:hypothetical protein
MVTEQIEHPFASVSRRNIRLELVDNGHKEWPIVAEWIARSGQSAQVLNEHGWLTARQIVVAAFISEKVVGHLGFRVNPQRAHGKIVLEAGIDSLYVENPSVEQLLFDRAQAHARLLGCRSLQREA